MIVKLTPAQAKALMSLLFNVLQADFGKNEVCSRAYKQIFNKIQRALKRSK